MELLKDIYLVGSGEMGISDAYDCHVYMLDGGDDAVLIDCGVGREPRRIAENINMHIPIERVSRVLLTHTHADHSGGAAYFQSRGVRVLAPEGEAALMEEKPHEVLEAFALAKNAGAYPGDCEYAFFKPDGVLRDGEDIQVGRYVLRAVQAGGHSEGLLCYYLDMGDRTVLFSSDYLFFGGLIGLLNCPGSELGAYRRDITKIAALKVDVLLPGHRMFALGGAEKHVRQAAENLSKVFVPPTF